MQKLELLAPAKNLETGIAAITHGADAVYIGAQRFGARASAGNSIGDIATLCDFAHKYRAKVYVTVNTLIRDNEKTEVEQLLRNLCDIDVDAILFQDMTVLAMFFRIVNERTQKGLSSPEAHASTQTDNRTADKVKALHSIGCSRVVLARELSIDEIADIHHKCPDTELEVFVHGALCVSYSGLCYASERCFGRSANRGECAQVCRMKFSLLDADDNVLIKDRYLLSLKDMCQIDNLERLIEAGAVSFKIEGRLKDVAYVKNVVAAYSLRLNDIIKKNPGKYCRTAIGTVNYQFEPSLAKTFNRGYTTYFANGRVANISSPQTPKAIGEHVGKVKEIRNAGHSNCSFNVAGTATFANGDGLCFINATGNLEGFRVNKVEGNRLFPLKMPKSLKPGTMLYRNSDMTFEKEIMRANSAKRTIPVIMKLAADNGQLILSAKIKDMSAANDNEEWCTVTVPFDMQTAETPQHNNIVRQLTKLGSTIFSCNKILMDNSFPYFVPSSILAQIRRELTAQLEKAIADTPIEHSTLNTERPTLNTERSTLNTELPTANTPLMQCRYCLRHALGFCVKNGGKRPEWHEPLRLRLGDGKTFRLQFDCTHCQMNLLYDKQ
ncbi:MAG: U32 family peptidase [Prevotella sp.]|nr:U32 family peptidase [Prevotella sp.]